jgi:hypothetical protein
MLKAAPGSRFRIVYPRFIDRFGGARLGELQRVFSTDDQAGKRALAASLIRVADDLGSYDEFAAKYPVSIIPPLPAYPLFPILLLETFQPLVLVNSGSQKALNHIKVSGRLAAIPHPEAPVLRQTPWGHWCAYKKWATPGETRRALQIEPAWSDCAARATLDSRHIQDLASSPIAWVQTIPTPAA